MLIVLSWAFPCLKVYAFEKDRAGEPELGLRTLFELEANWRRTNFSHQVPVRNFVAQEKTDLLESATGSLTVPEGISVQSPGNPNSSDADTKIRAGKIEAARDPVASGELNGFASGVTQLEPSDTPPGTGNMAVLEQGIKSVESLGRLPLPIARLSKEDPYAGNRIQNLAVGDLGGSPYGPYSGKTTFGSSASDESLQGLIANSANSEMNSEFPNSEDLPPESLYYPPSYNSSPKEEDRVKLEALKQDMDKLAQKETPYSENNYRTYEKAKRLFKDNQQLLRGINDLDDDFVKNARELYVDHSWQDLDKKGREPFADFIRRNEPKLSFPYPIGKEPKLKTHRGDVSH